ncbi:MAG TPA: hypothetical protein VGE94_15035, partial [Chloroflexota bacterium]
AWPAGRTRLPTRRSVALISCITSSSVSGAPSFASGVLRERQDLTAAIGQQAWRPDGPIAAAASAELFAP